MRTGPSWFRIYLWTLTISGLTVLVILTRQLTPSTLAIAFGFAVGVGALEMVRFVLPRGEVVSASSGLVLMILWVHGPAVAAVADAIAVLATALVRRSLLINTLFNIGQLTLSIVCAGAVFRLMGGLTGDSVMWQLTTLLTSGLTFLVVNSMLLERALAFYKRVPFFPLWWESVRQFGARFGPPLLFAIALVTGYPLMGSVFLLAIIVLLVGQYVLLRSFAHGSQERAVTSLLELTAQRDAYRPGHSDRVLRYSSAIGRQMSLGAGEMRILRYAALLHDVGLATLPPHVLDKESALAVEDRLQVERHPAEGARLLGQLAPLVPVARLVRHHHEWYNGSGYPDGLQGEEIPLGSQILSVADAFDAMTTDQPHRRAFSPQAALEELRRLSGVQFSGDVVSALERALDNDRSLVDFVSRRGRQDVDDEITLTIRHLKEYVTSGEPGSASIDQLMAADDDGHRDHQFMREVRRRAAGILVLYDLGRVINSSLSLKEVLDLVARTAGRTVNARCVVLLAEPGEEELSFAATYGLITPPSRLPRLHASEGPWGEALKTGRPVVLHVRGNGRLPRPLLALIAAEGLESFLFLPLIAKGRAIGLMCLCHSIVHRFNEQEQNLLSIIASQAALAIENAKLYSETKERLEQIVAMKQFTDAILENVNTGILVADERGQVQLANRVAKEIVGQVEPEVLSDDSWEKSVIFARLSEELRLDRVFTTGIPRYADAIEVAAGEQSLVVEAQASVFSDREGRGTGVIIVIRDITEKLKLEDQVRRAQQLAMVGQIAAGAAHEIRNPLTAVRGFVQVLQDRVDRQGQEREYMDIVVSEIDRIDELLTDLMLLAKPPALKLEFCCLHQLLDEQCLLMRGDPMFAGVQVGRQYDPELPLIRIDKNQIRQVLLNLCTNAAQAMPGGGTITLTTRYLAPNDEVELTIADTGEGISAQDRPRIFAPFFTTKERGTGLGLSLSYGIVRNHGGRIDVHSRGSGAEFTVWLPVRSDPDREVQATPHGGDNGHQL